MSFAKLDKRKPHLQTLIQTLATHLLPLIPQKASLPLSELPQAHLVGKYILEKPHYTLYQVVSVTEDGRLLLDEPISHAFIGRKLIDLAKTHFDAWHYPTITTNAKGYFYNHCNDPTAVAILNEIYAPSSDLKHMNVLHPIHLPEDRPFEKLEELARTTGRAAYWLSQIARLKTFFPEL